jgi:iron complex outermembrane recepter protein
VTASPTDNLSINYSLGLNEFLSSEDPTALDYRHPTSLLQPRRNMSAGIQYDFNFANGGTLSPRLDWFYQSKRTNGPANVEQRGPDHFIDEYDLFNIRVTYQTPERDWSISMAATNVTDEFYWSQLTSLTGTTPGVLTLPRGGVPGRPREWSVSLRKNF